MTSLLHLVMLFKPIKSTLMQSYLLFSPPSNAFLHLPCSSACPAPPQAQAGLPKLQNARNFCGVFFVQLSLPWHQQELMLWARALCILESSQSCPSSLHTTCSHVQPLPIPPRCWGSTAAPGTVSCRFQEHPSHSNLLLQSPARIPHTAPPGTSEDSPVTSGKATSTWATSPWPMVLNPYLNSHLNQLEQNQVPFFHWTQHADAASPQTHRAPQVPGCKTNSQPWKSDSEEQLKYEKWIRWKYNRQH